MSNVFGAFEFAHSHLNHMAGIWKKKKSKQPSPETTDSASQKIGYSGSQQTHYNTQSPRQETLIHSRNPSRDTTTSNAGTFSTNVVRGEIQSWMGYYRETFGGKNDIPRPSDEKIEEMFLELMNKRDLKNLSESHRKAILSIPIEKKWLLVKNDLLEEKTRPNSTNIVISSHDKNAPEWYLKRILDGTITVRDMNSLSVALRTLPIT
ncbi:11888_t:CDS:2, partial [Acaulospora colombiana]